MSRQHKRKRSSSFDGNPSKRRLEVRDGLEHENIVGSIELEHENIELLLYRRRILQELSMDDPFYNDAIGNLELQLLHREKFRN